MGWRVNRSAFKNFVICKNGLTWGVVFWRRGVFLLALPSWEVKAPSLGGGRSERYPKPCQTWVAGSCKCKTSFCSHKPCARFSCLVFSFKMGFPNENLASSTRQLKSVICHWIVVPRNGGIWSRQTLQERRVYAAPSPVATKDTAQQATASKSHIDKTQCPRPSTFQPCRQ